MFCSEHKLNAVQWTNLGISSTSKHVLNACSWIVIGHCAQNKNDTAPFNQSFVCTIYTISEMLVLSFIIFFTWTTSQNALIGHFFVVAFAFFIYVSYYWLLSVSCLPCRFLSFNPKKYERNNNKKSRASSFFLLLEIDEKNRIYQKSSISKKCCVLENCNRTTYRCHSSFVNVQCFGSKHKIASLLCHCA